MDHKIITVDDLPDDPAERFMRLRSDPWAFLCTCVRTTDPKDKSKPIKPAPVEKTYVWELTQWWLNNEFGALIKSRQMWCSWLFTALYLHDTISNVERNNFFVADVQEKADKELLKRAETMFNLIPRDIWIPDLMPKMRRVENFMYFDQIGSKIQALPSGEHKSRGYVASGVLNDEFAFWDNAQETLAAQRPSAARITLISTIPEQIREERPYFYSVVYDKEQF